MTAVLIIQTVAIVLLGVLVVGLLRSHAEILRTLHQLGAGADPAGVTSPVAAPIRRTASTGFDVTGTTPADEEVAIGVVGARQSTVLAFLSSGCLTCGSFWETFAGAGRTAARGARDTAAPGARDTAAPGARDIAVPGGARLVIVTKGPEIESPARIGELSPPAFPVVMSTQAWLEYKVPATPYFVYVDGPTGRIIGEGSAQTWDQVVSLWSQALADDAGTGEARADRELTQAGIHPGHDSLYPAQRAARAQDPAQRAARAQDPAQRAARAQDPGRTP